MYVCTQANRYNCSVNQREAGRLFYNNFENNNNKKKLKQKKCFNCYCRRIIVIETNLISSLDDKHFERRNNISFHHFYDNL